MAEFVRFDVVVDLARRNGSEGILYLQRWILRLLRPPDVVEAGATDAAGEVGMELAAGSAGCPWTEVIESQCTAWRQRSRKERRQETDATSILGRRRAKSRSTGAAISDGTVP